MNMTSCSVGNNPLVQLNNKHVNRQNTSLQQQNNNSTATFNDDKQDIGSSSQRKVNDINKFHMDNFINNNEMAMNQQHNIGSKPVQFDNSWSNVNQSNINHTVNHSWANDFKELPKNEYHPKYRTNNTINSPTSTTLHTPTTFMNRNMNHYTTLQSNTTKSDESIVTNWDKQFKDLENEVSNIEIDSKEQEQEQEKMDEEIEEIGKNYQHEFQEVWDSLQKDSEEFFPEDLIADHSILQDYKLNNLDKDSLNYEFDSNNEYLNNPNAYEIGCILMENGAKLSEAALAFEAAIKENPKHIDAWLKLGLVQTQNEKELNGIIALENCLNLQNDNLDAMKNLAISYINEGYDINSFTMLNRWVETKYSNLLNKDSNGISLENPLEQDRQQINEFVTKQFLTVANKLNKVDPDVQLCLGLLFYSKDEYDKTIDCFKTALQVSPNDESMWNRLGASLANSNRSEEAIQAYHKALNLKPSFVRARYNLAVSSINIGCYKQAAEHLLTALSMHEVEGTRLIEDNNNSNNNNNILETLKRAFVAMDRNDLVEKVHPGMNLNDFKQEFKF